jgi:hypothetical protein
LRALSVATWPAARVGWRVCDERRAGAPADRAKLRYGGADMVKISVERIADELAFALSELG